MSKRTLPRWRVWLAVGLLALLVPGYAVPIVQIQLRLLRNGEIGRRLPESLRNEFPRPRTFGTASYEREVVYIHVDGIDAEDLVGVERWLRNRKVQQQLAPEIWLIFEPASSKEQEIVKF